MMNALPAATMYGVTNPLQEQTSQGKVSEEIRTNNNERVELRSVENMDEDAGASETRDRGGDAGRAPPPPPPPGYGRRDAYFDQQGEFMQQAKASQESGAGSYKAVEAFLKNAEAQGAPARAGQGNAGELRPSVDATV